MSFGHKFGFPINRALFGDGAPAFNPANLANTFFYNDPTIASSINAGSPSPADPVSILGDLSAAANDGTQGTGINQPAWNTIRLTYTTNDSINIDNVQSDIATSVNGDIELWARPVDATPASNSGIISFGSTATNEFLIIQNKTDGKLRAILVIGGVTQWDVSTNVAAFTNHTWSHPRLYHNGTTPVLEVNNVAVATTFAITTDKTKWMNDLTAVDNGRIGCININGGGDTKYFTGDIQQVYISTDVKDTDTKTNLYNYNQPINPSAVVGVAIVGQAIVGIT